MSNATFAEAGQDEKEHFFPCGECGEMLDARCLDEVFEHEDHKPKIDIPYLRAKRMEPECPHCKVSLVDAPYSALDQLLNGMMFTGKFIKQCPSCRRKFKHL